MKVISPTSNHIKNKESSSKSLLFYLAWAILVVVGLTYLIFTLRIYFQSQKLNDVDRQISSLASEEQKASEKKVLDYKKKISYYTLLINSHKSISNIFALIEKRTLPNVWFYSFSMSQTNQNVRISGEAENLSILSRQVQALESSQDYINNLSVLSSDIQQSGRVNFTLSFNLSPQIFSSAIIP